MHPASTWTDSVSGLTNRLCAVAGRNLTTEEWEASLPFRPYRETCGSDLSRRRGFEKR